MNSTPSRARMIQNELLVRAENEKAQQMIQAHTPLEEQASLAIDFYCECSAADCQERVQLSLAEYGELHSRNDRFVVAVGHESPAVEKIVDTQDEFLIVEKYALPA